MNDPEMTWDAWLWVVLIVTGATAAFIASLIGGAFVLLTLGEFL